MRPYTLHGRRPNLGRTSLTEKNSAPWVWGLAGLGMGALAAALVFAPARWLAAPLQSGSAGRLALHMPQGTIWRGSAQLALGSGDALTPALALPGRVSWTLQPGWTSAVLTLAAPCCLQQEWVWSAHWGSQTLQLRAGDLPSANPARWPGSVLAGLGTPWNTLQLQGTLAFSSRGLAMRWSPAGWSPQGEMRLDALHLSTRLSPLPEVGSYRLSWIGQATSGPTLELSTLQGSLQLQGRGQWINGRLQFQGAAQASAAQEAALSNLLNIMGRREGARSIITVG